MEIHFHLKKILEGLPEYDALITHISHKLEPYDNAEIVALLLA